MVVTAPVNNTGKGESTRLAVAAHIHTFPEQTRGLGGGGRRGHWSLSPHSLKRHGPCTGITTRAGVVDIIQPASSITGRCTASNTHVYIYSCSEGTLVTVGFW